jgi:hypothetical protein
MANKTIRVATDVGGTFIDAGERHLRYPIERQKDESRHQAKTGRAARKDA